MYDFHWSFPFIIGFVICLFISSYTYSQSYGMETMFNFVLKKNEKDHTRENN